MHPHVLLACAFPNITYIPSLVYNIPYAPNLSGSWTSILHNVSKLHRIHTYKCCQGNTTHKGTVHDAPMHPASYIAGLPSLAARPEGRPPHTPVAHRQYTGEWLQVTANQQAQTAAVQLSHRTGTCSALCGMMRMHVCVCHDHERRVMMGHT